MYKIIINDTNKKLTLKNGKNLRTPTTITIESSELNYWKMYLTYSRILDYEIVDLNEKKKDEKIKETKKQIEKNYIPIRPSRLKRRNNR